MSERIIYLSGDAEIELERISERQLELEALKEAATTTDEQHRLGLSLYGLSKHRGHVGNVASARRDGEHRFIIHGSADAGVSYVENLGTLDDPHDDDDLDAIYAICSCGFAKEGTMHDDFTPEEFLAFPGHIDFAAPPAYEGGK